MRGSMPRRSPRAAPRPRSPSRHRRLRPALLQALEVRRETPPPATTARGNPSLLLSRRVAIVTAVAPECEIECRRFADKPRTAEPDDRNETELNPARCTCQPGRHDNRVVRLLSVWDGRRARLEQALLPDVRSAGGHAGVAGHLLRRFRGEAD